MKTEEYLRRRLHLAEEALRYLMAIVIEQSSPNSQALIQRMGFEWDQQLDRLDSEQAWSKVQAGEGDGK